VTLMLQVRGSRPRWRSIISFPVSDEGITLSDQRVHSYERGRQYSDIVISTAVTVILLFPLFQQHFSLRHPRTQLYYFSFILRVFWNSGTVLPTI